MVEKEHISVIKGELSKPIVLVGLMGAGKTSLGRALAKTLNVDFIDSDDVIIAKDGRSIAEMFARSGEGYFRDLERQVLVELSKTKRHCVLGTGGGAFMNDETRQVIKAHTTSVFLKADIEILKKRVGTGEGRPLFKGKSVEEVLKTLIEERYPIYNQADLTVETRDESRKETLNRLISALYIHLKP